MGVTFSIFVCVSQRTAGPLSIPTGFVLGWGLSLIHLSESIPSSVNLNKYQGTPTAEGLPLSRVCLQIKFSRLPPWNSGRRGLASWKCLAVRAGAFSEAWERGTESIRSPSLCKGIRTHTLKPRLAATHPRINLRWSRAVYARMGAHERRAACSQRALIVSVLSAFNTRNLTHTHIIPEGFSVCSGWQPRLGLSQYELQPWCQQTHTSLLWMTVCQETATVCFG